MIKQVIITIIALAIVSAILILAYSYNYWVGLIVNLILIGVSFISNETIDSQRTDF